MVPLLNAALYNFVLYFVLYLLIATTITVTDG